MAVLSIALSQVDGFPEEPKAVLFNAESLFKASAMTYLRPALQVDAAVDMEMELTCLNKWYALHCTYRGTMATLNVKKEMARRVQGSA